MQQPIPAACDNLTQRHWFHSLPLQQFQALLTLFPKSFSPFPHGTCFLSVPNHCLTSDESYHPICAPIPRNVTLRRHTVHRGAAHDNQDSHLRWCSFPRDLHMRLCWQCLTRLQVKAKGPNFHAEFIPVHSPLLWGSCLVSCPPLTYMLKFSRWSSLTSCLINHTLWHMLGFRANRKLTITQAQQAVGNDKKACIRCNKGEPCTHWHTIITLPIRFSVADWMRPYRHQRRHAFRYSPKAHNTFKALLIHGILQFTKIITLRCALHRCSSRGIHRWKLWSRQYAHTNLHKGPTARQC